MKRTLLSRLRRIRVPLRGRRLETRELRLGFVALTDSAVLFAAREQGYFARHGLRVHLSREASWANVRDKVSAGMLDGAQMLAPMPLAATLGIGAAARPMITALTLDLNGNGITVRRNLYEEMRRFGAGDGYAPAAAGPALAALVEARARQGMPPLTFAMVAPFSTHAYQLRYWLAMAGLDPDRDLRIIVLPPSAMVENLEAGLIDGFCVGEPWNTLAVRRGVGRLLLSSSDLWRNAQEKVLGVTREWALTHPRTHQALLRALLEASAWSDDPRNRPALARMVADRSCVDLPYDVAEASLTNRLYFDAEAAPISHPDLHAFYRYAAAQPWISHGMWYLTQILRWGQLDRPVDLRAAVEEVYRPDLYREAARALGLSIPDRNEKVEGIHEAPYTVAGSRGPVILGADRFLDGRIFDPADPVGYLERLPGNRLRVDFAALRAANGTIATL